MKNRKRKSNATKRTMNKRQYKEEFQNLFNCSVLSSMPVKPHCLTELSMRQKSRFLDNCITVSDLKFFQDESSNSLHSEYDKVSFGKNVKYCKCADLGSDIGNMYNIHLDKMRNRTLLITMPVDECKKSISLTTYVLNSMLEHGSYGNNQSGLVVLGLISLAEMNENIIWTNKDILDLRKYKPNVVREGEHFQSKGSYFSFGNRANYRKDGNSSVTLYADKIKNNGIITKQEKIRCEAIERKSEQSLSYSINKLSIYLPNVNSLLSPILDTVLKVPGGRNILKKAPKFSNGIFKTSICVNASTKVFHTESDCTYTVVHVPNQDLNIDEDKQHTDRNFLFKLNQKITICIPMKPGISIMFSGAYLTHRQALHANDSNFLNLSAYGNSTLFNHIRKSLKRLPTKS